MRLLSLVMASSSAKTDYRTLKIRVEPLSDLKPKDILQTPEKLGFGKYFTDRMFYMEYDNGWQEPIIKKLTNLSLHPAASVFHYAQEIFEGMKAHRQDNGKIVIFRPDRNIDRFNVSAERMCMPQIDPNVFMEGLKSLIRLEQEWVPNALESSLYIRPTFIGVDPVLGVKPSSKYYFYIILSPSGPYFKDGFKPVKIHVTDKYVRAVPGGVGNAKTGGNYARSLLAIKEAQEKYNASQVLFLDAYEHKYVEEVGAMNIFFVKDKTIYTAPLEPGTILPGVTRESVIQLCKDFDMPLVEESLSIDDIITGIKNGSVTECFGSGTAAVIASVGELIYKDHEHVINKFEIGPVTKKLYDTLVGIQKGRIPDKHGWIVPIS